VSNPQTPAAGPQNAPGAQVEAPPLVEDVTFRMSAKGDAIGFDLECRDGSVRRLVFPIDTLPKLLAGFLWSGAEAADRAAPPKVSEEFKSALQDGARLASGARLIRLEGVRDVVLEMEVGAAVFAVRIPDTWAETLGVALLEHVNRNRDTPPQ
jgi:hypothetical protein